MNARRALIWLSITASIASLPPSAGGAEPDNPLAFKPADGGGYAFDTGVLRGMLRQDGKSRALSNVVHLPTGIRLDGSVGIAGHYRVFTANRRYGTAAWDWPSTAELLPDGSVQTTWPEASDRPFEMTAHYRWAAPQVLDVVTTVAARENLSGFESFFASYMNEAFPTPYAWARSEEPRTQSHFLRGDKNYGDWLMFISPGDPRADVIQDGRWLLDPHPVKWTVLPRLDAPLCLRRNENPKLAVLVMAPREDCFTVAMPHEGESHYSLYLSLFGRNVKAGETATARARLIVAGDVSDEQALELYDRYLKSLGERRT